MLGGSIMPANCEVTMIVMNLYGGLTMAGLADPNTIRSLHKALESSAVTDEATLTGGAAFRVQSLDNLMQNTSFEDDDLQFYPSLKVRPVIGILDQYVVRSAYGGGYNFAPQGKNPPATSGTYARKVLPIKFALTYRELTHVMTTMDATGGNVVNAMAAEEKAGALEIGSSLERCCFLGDSAVILEEFDGLATWIANNGDSRTIKDMAATKISSLTTFFEMAGVMGSNAGRLTNIYMDTYSKMDFDLALQNAMRFGPGDVNAGMVAYGGIPNPLHTSFGSPTIKGNLFLNPEQGFINPEDQINTDPYYKASSSSRGGDASLPAPSAPAVTCVAAGADGNGTNMPTGTYQVTASAIRYNGESAADDAVAVVLTAGEHMAWSIACDDSTVEGFRLFKSAVDGEATDMREFARIARSANPTTYTDTGADIPGTTKAFGVDQRPEIGAVDWDQLLGLTRLQLAILAPTNPWLQLLYGALRVTKPKRLYMVKNILPTAILDAGWNPLGV